MHTISLEEALVLFQLPRTLGDLDGVPLTVGVGRFGPFVKHGSTYASLGKEDDPYTIDFERGKALLIAKAEAIANRSEEHTSELQSLMRISYAVFCLKKKKITNQHTTSSTPQT